MKLSLHYYLSIILFSLCFSAYAQEFSISGTVVDANSEPIDLANIIILAEDGTTFIKGTSTGEKGYFKLNNLTPTAYFIRISFIGFEEFEQKIILSGHLNLKTIQLAETAENLDEVTVIAKKPTITRKPDRLIFNVENTALTEGSTLGVLKNTPGIIVTEGGINIKSAQAAIFINNRRVQLTSDELIQLLESSPANSIKSVEVITNPPASYDADSGSVINIIMSKNLVTGYRGSVQTNYTQGVFPRYNAATSHYFKNDKFNFNVNYSYTNQKINRDQDDRVNFLDNANEVNQIWQSDVNRNTWSESHTLNLSLDYFIDDKNTLSLTSTGLYTPYFKYQINNNTDIRDQNQDFLSRFTADNLSRDNKYNIGSNLIFRHNFENNAALTFDAHYTTYNYERDQNVFSNFFDVNNAFSNASEFNTLANQSTNIITGKIDYNLPINESSSFDAGAKYSNVNTNSDITRVDIVNGTEFLNTANTDAFKYDEKVFAAYSNYSKSWDKWDLNIGLRVEQTNIEGESQTLNQTNTQDYFSWFPNASVSHQAAKDVTVYGNYKRSITRPSFKDLNPFTFFINENTIVTGNPNLVPAFIDHFSVGISFLKYFTVEAYYMNYENDSFELPRQDNATNILAFTPLNLDQRTDFGFDFLFDYNITNNWNLYAVTSFFNMAEATNFDDDFIEKNQWSNLSQLSNSLSLLEDNSLNINLSVLYLSRNLQYFSSIEDRVISSLSVSKSVFNKRAMISLTVEDLFNQQDFDISTRYLNQSNSSFSDLDNRTIKLGFRYKFGNTKLNTNERSTNAEERDRIKDLN